jgi:hypothetical protein
MPSLAMLAIVIRLVMVERLQVSWLASSSNGTWFTSAMLYSGEQKQEPE